MRIMYFQIMEYWQGYMLHVHGVLAIVCVVSHAPSNEVEIHVP